jgi:hypothetical protein
MASFTRLRKGCIANMKDAAVGKTTRNRRRAHRVPASIFYQAWILKLHFVYSSYVLPFGGAASTKPPLVYPAFSTLLFLVLFLYSTF